MYLLKLYLHISFLHYNFYNIYYKVTRYDILCTVYTYFYKCRGKFVMEYVGEVLDYREFKNRTKLYAKTMNEHYYFMSLNADEIIDATAKGNCSRFINHSCDPNCETQKVSCMLSLSILCNTRAILGLDQSANNIQW